MVVADTDDHPCNLRAISLHRALVVGGEQVRILALAPGRTGELAGDVPVMAPSRRSFAARTQLVAESRWADVVVLSGTRTLTWSTSGAVGSNPPVVLLLCEDGVAAERPPRRAERRSARAAARLVVPAASTLEPAALRYDRAPADVVVIDPAEPDALECWRSLLGEVARGAPRC